MSFITNWLENLGVKVALVILAYSAFVKIVIPEGFVTDHPGSLILLVFGLLACVFMILVNK